MTIIVLRYMKELRPYLTQNHFGNKMIKKSLKRIESLSEPTTFWE